MVTKLTIILLERGEQAQLAAFFNCSFLSLRWARLHLLYKILIICEVCMSELKAEVETVKKTFKTPKGKKKYIIPCIAILPAIEEMYSKSKV